MTIPPSRGARLACYAAVAAAAGNRQHAGPGMAPLATLDSGLRHRCFFDQPPWAISPILYDRPPSAKHPTTHPIFTSHFLHYHDQHSRVTAGTQDPEPR